MGSSVPIRIVLSYPIPTPHGFVLSIPSPPAWQGKFSYPILVLWGPAKPHPAPSHKTLLFVNLPTITTIVFNKTCFVNKNNLKLQINLSHQIKLIFSKNWIILLKCLTRQYHNKNKNRIIKNQWFNSI